MNTQYRKNLKAVATACKNYTDEEIKKLKLYFAKYELNLETDDDVAYQKSLPSGTISLTLDSIGGMSYKSENLLILNDVAETTVGSLTYSISNGVLTLNGTVSGIFNISDAVNSQIATMDTSKYTVKWFAENITGATGYVGFTNYYDNYINIGTNTTSQSNGKTIGTSIQINSTSTFTNAKFKPMLVNGTTAPTEFKQGFTGIRDSAVTSVKITGTGQTDIIKQIPAEIQALEGYGWGIDDTCYNYIDLITPKTISSVNTTKSFNKVVDESNLGGLSYAWGDTYVYSEGFSKSNAKILAILPSPFTAIRVSVNGNLLITFPSGSFNNVAEVKQALNGVVALFELATPVETDISQYLTDFNPINTNNLYTDIEFVNQYNADVPNTITCLVEEVKS